MGIGNIFRMFSKHNVFIYYDSIADKRYKYT